MVIDGNIETGIGNTFVQETNTDFRRDSIVDHVEDARRGMTELVNGSSSCKNRLHVSPDTGTKGKCGGQGAIANQPKKTGTISISSLA